MKSKSIIVVCSINLMISNDIFRKPVQLLTETKLSINAAIFSVQKINENIIFTEYYKLASNSGEVLKNSVTEERFST